MQADFREGSSTEVGKTAPQFDAINWAVLVRIATLVAAPGSVSNRRRYPLIRFWHNEQVYITVGSFNGYVFPMIVDNDAALADVDNGFDQTIIPHDLQLAIVFSGFASVAFILAYDLSHE